MKKEIVSRKKTKFNTMVIKTAYILEAGETMDVLTLRGSSYYGPGTVVSKETIPLSGGWGSMSTRDHVCIGKNCRPTSEPGVWTHAHCDDVPTVGDKK
jgi:hypothetical protein